MCTHSARDLETVFFLFEKLHCDSDSVRVRKKRENFPCALVTIFGGLATAILAQVGIDPSPLPPGLGFRCICHLCKIVETRKGQGFVCCVHSHGPSLVSPSYRVRGRSLWWKMGTRLGRRPAPCETCGRSYPRPNVSLADSMPARMDKKRKNSSQKTESTLSRRVSWASRGNLSREHTEAGDQDELMEDCQSRKSWQNTTLLTGNANGTLIRQSYTLRHCSASVNYGKPHQRRGRPGEGP